MTINQCVHRLVRKGRVLGASAALALTVFSPAGVQAGDGHAGPTIAKNHAPIGVMGDHLHKKGEWMVAARYMHMAMGGNRIGKTAITPDAIVTGVPNRFAGAPMQPPTLRVVPTQMSMEMAMLGAMYGVSDRLTVMAMGMASFNSMDHTTYMGGMGTSVLGSFTTKSGGISDLSVSALLGLGAWTQGNIRHDAHLHMGVSIPVGSIGERDAILTPMGMTPTVRLPYPMQLGSGTYDFLPGMTYNGRTSQYSWGAQYRANIRSGANKADYRLGHRHLMTGWVQYGVTNALSFSLRGVYERQGAIKGIDPSIVAPVQTANPDFQGGERVELGLGMNLAGQSGLVKGHRLAVELMLPLLQNLNGPQLERDWSLTVGWQKAF